MNASLPDSKRVQHLEFMRAIGIAKSMLDVMEEQFQEELKGVDNGEE